jgi:hypothetical protein
MGGTWHKDRKLVGHNVEAHWIPLGQKASLVAEAVKEGRGWRVFRNRNFSDRNTAMAFDTYKLKDWLIVVETHEQ